MGSLVDSIFGGGDTPQAPAAPDYTALAQASTDAAKMTTKLGREQLAEARRQYDQNYAVASPVIKAQLGLMDQQKSQGDDYYNYMVQHQRPVENALNDESMTDYSARDATDRQSILDRYYGNDSANQNERALITGGDTGVYNARRDDIEQGVGRAVADARSGQASAQNQLIRQGLRYGWSPAKLAAMASQQGLGQASQQASAANGARMSGIANARAMLGQNYDMRNAENGQMIAGLSNNRNMRIQDNATSWAKKLDVAGLYRNLPGASQGAYGLSTNAGNSAVSNSLQPGNQLLTGMSQGASTIGAGQGLKVSGLSSLIGSQTSAYNTGLQGQYQNSGGGLGGMLAMANTAANIYAASDRRLKENIELVGEDEKTGLRLYEFNYLGVPSARYRGVMADEVEHYLPEAVQYTDEGFALVNYELLGIEMVEVDHALDA